MSKNTAIQTVVAEVPFNARKRLNNQYRVVYTEYPSKQKVEIYDGTKLQKTNKFTSRYEAIKDFEFYQHALLKSKVISVK
jgi:hypothetical protein